MRDFAQSLIRFPWALSLFGIQQIANVLTPEDADRGTRRAVDTFKALTLATEEQFGGVIKGAFKSGDKLQRAMVDQIFTALTPDALETKNLMGTTTATLQQSAEALLEGMQVATSGRGCGYALLPAWGLRVVLPPLVWLISLLGSGRHGHGAGEEFINKLEVIEWVENVESMLCIPSGTWIPLPELVARAYALDPFPALWALEGLGNYFAERSWEQDGIPKSLLTSYRSGALPDKSLAMLHAGMGLSFAARMLRAVRPQSPASENREILRQFVSLCRDNSVDGYVGAALESLGLVARSLYPSLVPLLDQQLLEIDGNLAAYFWHGAGRAIYFAPINFLPDCGSCWRAAEMCRREAPHELGRFNALSGLVWAVTLVNMRRPEVIKGLLKHSGCSFPETDAFSNGVESSLIMRYDTTPGDPSIAAFCQHQPDPCDPVLLEAWNSQVRKPCERALQHFYGPLKERNRIDEVFRYQSLPELVRRMNRIRPRNLNTDEAPFFERARGQVESASQRTTRERAMRTG